jgi:hypothetical protein
MVGASDRHTAVVDELVEWWEDVSQQGINSQAVLVPVPPRWGRTCLLDRFTGAVEHDEAVGIVVRVPGRELPDGLGLQALKLRQLFSEARVEHRVAELLGVDRLGGVVQLGLGVAGLFVSPLAALVGLLLAGVGVGAAGRAWDDSPAGQEGVVAKLGQAVAAVSVSAPVVVVIDDADRLEPDLGIILIENLIERIDGHVLVVAAVNPDGNLLSELTSRAMYGLTEGRVHAVEADPEMGYEARADLIAELRPQLPAAAIRRIGQRTQTFAEVFAVAAAERLADPVAGGADAAIEVMVNEVIDDKVNRAPASPLAVVLAWAGSILHVRQAERAVGILAEGRQFGTDGDVVQFESLIQLADPASPRPAEKRRGLAAQQRHRMAQIVLDTAMEIGEDSGAGLVEKVVAWQGVHRVRTDLQDRSGLLGVQCQLVRGLEGLGDLGAAYQVAKTAQEEYLAGQPNDQQAPEQGELATALLRLARTRTARNDPLVKATVAAAARGGAAVGLEARIWAAVDLLAQPGQRKQALELTNQIITELNGRSDLGAVGNRWRLLLAFHAGRAGYPAIAQRLLASMLVAPSPPEDQDAARAVLYAVSGLKADTRLQVIGLEAELQALPSDAVSDRLRVHHVLAVDYADLGDYGRALDHAHLELPLRRDLQGADHPSTLTARHDIARWTGHYGHQAEALRLYKELLPDLVRVLGPDHPSTLAARGNIAGLAGDCGDLAEALRLDKELLPDLVRVLGPDHPNTLVVRNNIARWAGECGHHAEALGLSKELLPDQERVLGPDHPDTLATRGNIAVWTGQCGDRAEALRLYKELLLDRERVLGPDHPDTLATRSGVAFSTGECGHQAEALRLYKELLPDLERGLGPDHPITLTTRNNLAGRIAERGDQAEALRLSKVLLPDLKRVLGPYHPNTLTTRGNIVSWTAERGNRAEALRLSKVLLPDLVRVLGPYHPDTLATRGNIIAWTAECGDQAEAGRLAQELVAEVARLLGSDHPIALATRRAFQQFDAPHPAQGD